MAWNPSPEVAVARDAANKLAPLIGAKLDRCVIVYTLEDGRLGYVSYGANKRLCDEAKAMADDLYDAAENHLIFEASKK